MRRFRFLAGAAAVAVLVAMSPAAPARATDSGASAGSNAAPGAAPRLLGTLSTADIARHDRARKPDVVESTATVAAGTSCVTTAPGSKERALGAVSSCTRLTPTVRTKRVSRAADPCDIGQSGYWIYTRSGSCFKDFEGEYWLLDDRGRIIGTAEFLASGSMTLSPGRATFTEHLTVTVTDTDRQVLALNIAMDAACTGACSMADANPWDGMVTLVEGASASGTVTYAASPSAGTQTNIQTSYHMFVVALGAIPIQPNYNWSNPWNVRCDNSLAVSGTTGCVYAAVRAQLVLPLSQYRAAAATYAFAQIYLIDHWGAEDSPLRRQADTAIANSNRRATCETPLDPFIPFDDSVVVDDSCDEYPFAATQQGGTTGSFCADIVALQEADGLWYFYEARADKPVDFNEPCVRGHVPLGENESAGGKVGSLPQSERVIDNEAYTVAIT
ncbi:NucA/NucB deoxyribonuclease domain-containing protein [Plantactinospora soyae]|uniref:Deoxyribonuclease NucA/NucB domain-containing protein n=1 Tax=Plantactinospora soyae TaxID=1544732 RepID=A0A927M5C4_9ACTN|nr:hypothetical protein [Plantactinospora soyae]MBE1488274.1 hypothetical protein [Plantactinospora soyae]